MCPSCSVTLDRPTSQLQSGTSQLLVHTCLSFSRSSLLCFLIFFFSLAVSMRGMGGAGVSATGGSRGTGCSTYMVILSSFMYLQNVKGPVTPGSLLYGCSCACHVTQKLHQDPTEVNACTVILCLLPKERTRMLRGTRLHSQSEQYVLLLPDMHMYQVVFKALQRTRLLLCLSCSFKLHNESFGQQAAIQPAVTQ